jgi:hypothetical protein
MFKRIALFVGGAILSCGVAFAQTSVTGKVVASEDVSLLLAHQSK